MKRTGFVLNFPTEFATNHPHNSGRKCSCSLGLVFLFYSRKKMISGVPSLVMPFKYCLQNCFIFIFSLKATVTAELSVAVSKDGN